MTASPVALELVDRCTFPAAGTEITCAVSGGADSLALLVLAVAAGCRVTAVHVDHGLRPGSAAEAGVVAAAAQRYGAAFRSEQAPVPAGGNLEARARAARYAVLPPGALIGHTADDQAETVLLNLMRGAGLDGLAGIDPGRRPLLALRRAETQMLCSAEGLQPVDDPSNADPSFLRNRVRSEVVPLLNDLARRDVVPVIARQAGHLRDDADLLNSLAATLAPDDARALRAAPVALARRAVRGLLAGEHPPDAAGVARVLEVASGARRATEVRGRGTVRRRRGRLSVE